VVTRSGFERNRQGELAASYGSYNNTNNQISFGDHTARFAYYGSLSAIAPISVGNADQALINDQAEDSALRIAHL